MPAGRRRLTASLKFVFGFPVLCLLFPTAFPTGAAEPAVDARATAAELLPETTVAYLEITDLAGAVDVVMNHPLRKRVESMPAFQVLLGSDQYSKFKEGIAVLEGSMGASWQQSIAGLSDGGIYVALDRESEGAALLMKSSDRDRLTRFRNFLLAITQLGQGDVGIVQQGDYRGYTAHALSDKLKMALIDDWLLITNRAELGKSIIDRHVDGSETSFETSPNYQSARQQENGRTAFAFVDLDAIRDAGVAPDLYRGTTDNVVAEALFGGIAATLKHAPYATAAASIERAGLRASLSTPHQADWTQGREYYVGENEIAAAPPLLHVPDQIFAASTYRDLSQMWLLAPDLMTDKANEDLAKADTNLTTIFSGRDFGEDILGSLHPEIQLVVARQSFSETAPIPAIRLPEFALQFRMRDAEGTAKEFRRVFQSLIGFVNIVGAMQGQPQFDIDFRSLDDATLIQASYVPPIDQDDYRSAAINYNFAPTLAFAGERLVLGSTTSIVEKTLRAVGASDDDASDVNSHAVLNANRLRDVLEDNRAQLVAQNMLEKGHGHDQANAEIGVLFEILSLFEGVSTRLDFNNQRMEFSAAINVDSNDVEPQSP